MRPDKTQPDPAPWDLEVLSILRARDGVETFVDLANGSRLPVLDIAWGYDIGDEYSHITTNCSPGAPGQDVEFFYTNEVVALVDPRMGTVLVQRPAPAEVTAAEVEQLWNDAVEGNTQPDVRLRAVALLERANAANPVVEDGLHVLLMLLGATQGPDQPTLVAARDSWRARLCEFESDPSGWMRDYFGRMLREFSDRHGRTRAQSFGEKLVREGHLTDAELRHQLGP